MKNQESNQKPAEQGIVSLLPSDAVGGAPDYGGSSSSDIRIFCKRSINRLHQAMRMLSRFKGISLGELQRDYSLKIVDDGWHDETILKLVALAAKTENLSLLTNDFCVDSVLDQSKAFSPGETSGSFTIRIWNDKVLDGLKTQAAGCDLDSSMYIQLMMLRKLLSYVDWCRSNKKASIVLGNSEGNLREALSRFDRWLQFRLKYREFLVSEYGKQQEL